MKLEHVAEAAYLVAQRGELLELLEQISTHQNRDLKKPRLISTGCCST